MVNDFIRDLKHLPTKHTLKQSQGYCWDYNGVKYTVKQGKQCWQWEHCKSELALSLSVSEPVCCTRKWQMQANVHLVPKHKMRTILKLSCHCIAFIVAEVKFWKTFFSIAVFTEKLTGF